MDLVVCISISDPDKMISGKGPLGGSVVYDL